MEAKDQECLALKDSDVCDCDCDDNVIIGTVMETRDNG